MADLSVSLARLRAGISLASPGQCLHYLSDAEYRLGDWDNALIHSELAVSLAHDTDRIWDLAFVHGFAAVVPAARGDWQLASGHVEASLATARAIGTGTGVTSAARPAPSWRGPAVTGPECWLLPHRRGHWAGTRSPVSPPTGAPWSSRP